MKVCIYGAGAVGGHLAARLADGGAEVSIIARGAHLAAIRENGLRVDARDAVLQSRPSATDDPATLGPQDVVVVTVKAPSLPQIAEGIAPLLDAKTQVVFLMNGIPWWYFHDHDGPLEGTRLGRIDPDGKIWRAIDPSRVIGGVAYTACTVTAPGIIRAANPRNRIILGRPDSRLTPIVTDLAETMRAGGLEVELTDTIRNAIWEKLLMNLVGGSLGILTESAMGDALSHPAVEALARDIATEGAAIATALGCDAGDIEAGLSKLKTSTHKQSILQDLNLGRAMEIDALLVAPTELARMVGITTPILDRIVGLAVLRARSAGLYAG